MTVMQKPLMMTVKISYMFTKFFENAKKNKTIPGLESSVTVDQNAIDKCSLAFLTENCGDFKIKIVDDPNLNNEILDIFAQTFVRHFWNDSIGYDNELSFWFRLRAFFDENLPLWAQYFREAIIDNKALFTSVNVTKGNNVDVLHVEGVLDASGNNKTDNSTKSHTDDQGTTNNSGNDSYNDEINSSGNKTDRNSGRKFNANANTPQSQVNLANGDTDDPLSSYNFDYASDVNGENNLNYDDENTKTNTKTNHEGSNSDNFTRNLTTDIKNSAQANARTKSTTNNTTDQTHTNIIDESSTSRNANLFDLANQMSGLANGAYMNLFNKMMRMGLFLGVY